MKFGGGRDVISGLPEALSCHILSFLPTKEAASTSVLSRKWRYLFAFVPNLDFDDSVYLNPVNQKKIPITITDFMEISEDELSTSFMDFVDRVLALQGNSPLDRFSLKVKDGVDPSRINSWIDNVSERGLSNLDLYIGIRLEPDFLVSPELFLSKTLIRLKLSNPDLDVEDVHLPKLKTLCLESVHFEKHGIGLTKLLSGCHILEDLVL